MKKHTATSHLTAQQNTFIKNVGLMLLTAFIPRAIACGEPGVSKDEYSEEGQSEGIPEEVIALTYDRLEAQGVVVTDDDGYLVPGPKAQSFLQKWAPEYLADQDSDAHHDDAEFNVTDEHEFLGNDDEDMYAALAAITGLSPAQVREEIEAAERAEA